jgi:hypothetical protein
MDLDLPHPNAPVLQHFDRDTQTRTMLTGYRARVSGGIERSPPGGTWPSDTLPDASFKLSSP